VGKLLTCGGIDGTWEFPIAILGIVTLKLTRFRAQTRESKYAEEDTLVGLCALGTLWSVYVH
jgi:hypothetical protein